MCLLLLLSFSSSFSSCSSAFSSFSSSPPLLPRDEKQAALKKLQATTKEEMWQTDLDEFIAKLDEVEEKEKKEEKDNQEPAQKGFKKVAGKKGQVKQETRPSAHGIRIDPIIGDDLKIKAAKAANAKANKANKAEGKVRKKAKDEYDEFDDMADDKNNTSLSKKLGNTPNAILKGKSKGSAKKGKAKNPWSDSDGDDPDSDADLSDVVDEPVAPREKAAGSRRAAANIKFDKYNSDDSEESGSDDELFENSGIAEPAATKKQDQSVYDIDSDDSPVKKKAAPKKQAAITDSFKPKAKAAASDSDSDDEGGHANGKSNGNGVSNGNGKKNASKDEFDVSDSGSDFGGGFASKVASKAKKPAKKLGTSDDLFDSMLADDDDKPEPPKKAVNKRPGLYSEDESDNSDFDGAKPKKKAPKKAAKKSYDSDDSGSDFDEPKPKKAPAKKPAAPKAPKADKPKKAAAPKKKKGSDSEDDAPKPKKAKAAPKPKKKTFDSDDMSGSDFEVTDVGPARDRPGTGRNTFDFTLFNFYSILSVCSLNYFSAFLKLFFYHSFDHVVLLHYIFLLIYLLEIHWILLFVLPISPNFSCFLSSFPQVAEPQRRQ